MTRSALKKKAHEYIELVDDKILNAVYTILEASVHSSETELEFTPQLKRELDKAKKDHLAGKSKSYTLEEVRKSVLSKLKK